MTTDQRARRNAEVFSARARGLTWPTIASRFGLSERQCRRIFAEHREAIGSLEDLDPTEIVRDTLDAYDAAIEELALLAEGSSHDGARLGAVRGRLDAIRSKWELMQAIGVFPSDLGQLWPEFDAAQVARRIVDVLDNHRISPEVQQEIAQAVEERHAHALPTQSSPAAAITRRSSGSRPDG